MKDIENKGFDTSVIEEYRSKMKTAGRMFLLDPDEERADEYAHFYFIGRHDDKEVIFDTVLYTLRLQHESELHEIAEHRAAQHFPEYKRISYEEDENGNLESLDSLEEEIGLYIAEIIMELEEDESVKVQEHIDVDEHADFGIGLDVGLHVEKVTDSVIERFITNYTNGTLTLDQTLYTFQTQELDD